MFFPNFLTFILEDSKFVSTIKTKERILLRLQICLDIEAQKKKKIDIYIFLSIMFKKKRTNFSNIKRAVFLFAV